MTHKEVLMLAIEALEDYGHAWPNHVVQYTNAITAIKEALAQPEQEPVAFMDKEKFEHLKKNNAVLTTVTSWGAFDDDVALYTTPPQRNG